MFLSIKVSGGCQV